MTAKEYLEKHANHKSDISDMESRINELRQRKKQIHALKFGTPRAKRKTDLSDAEAAIDELIRSYEDSIKQCVRHEEEIGKRIGELIDPEERKVLRLLYVMDKKLTWYEIAEELHVSKRTAQNIHSRALLHFRTP